jgi:hypothetical protein
VMPVVFATWPMVRSCAIDASFLMNRWGRR